MEEEKFGETDRLGKADLVIGAAVGIAAFAVYSVFPYGSLPPDVCAEAAAVAGLRPPVGPFPGLWRLVASLLGTDAGILAAAGRIAAGLYAFLLYGVLRNAFAILSRPSQESVSAWSRFLAPAACALAACSGIFADPLWRIFAVLSPAAVTLLAVTLAVFAFERWLVRGGRWRVYPLMLLTGVAAAESPFALVLPILFAVGFVLANKAIDDGRFQPHHSLPDAHELPKWRMLLVFLAGFLAVMFANGRLLADSGAFGAYGWPDGQVVFRMGHAYVKMLFAAAGWSGWVLAAGLCALPFVVAVNLFPRATDDGERMRFSVGISLLLTGIVAYFDQGPIRGAWFWTWGGDTDSIRSAALLAVVSVTSTLSFALAAAGFAFDAFLRTEFRTPRQSAVYRAAAVVLTLAAVAAVVPALPHANTRAVLDCIDAAVRETVRECGDATWVFTDGSLDPELELEAHRLGRRLYAVNLMGTSSNYDRAVRRRGLEDETDVKSADTGAAVLLRVWAGEKTNGLDRAAMQLGFEFWKRDQRPLPPLSAFVGRTRGLSAEDERDAEKIAKEFSERVFALSAAADSTDVPPSVRNAFASVMWRLSRFARLRNDDTLADKLDDENGILKRLMERLEYERMRAFMQLTPREGLQLALKRADFVEARRYAATVLHYDGDDPEANFALGMSFLSKSDWKSAETYLRKCLVRRPDEPAVLNNLSILARKQKRYEEAEKLARKAVELLPNSQEAKRTLDDAIHRAP